MQCTRCRTGSKGAVLIVVPLPAARSPMRPGSTQMVMSEPIRIYSEPRRDHNHKQSEPETAVIPSPCADNLKPLYIRHTRRMSG